MFANMKKKIFEEVKASPQKLQQFAQAAQAAVSSASSTASESVSGSDNFFSITEEDTPQNSPHKDITNFNKAPSTGSAASPVLLRSTVLTNNGVPVSRARRLSNSSAASDVSFRLPTYDSPAVYHLQSDLDISASEVEESTVSSTSHLDLISKEQLHSAYKKALDRYQKYRSRYTDLAKRYRDLERDSTKARAVLVETQDKAIRRISELREQCSLEQQAKAHLEEALRLEMDDMQCRIQAYQTKLGLLGQNSDAISQTGSKSSQEDSLIKFDSDENTTAETTNIEKLNLSQEKGNAANNSMHKYIKKTEEQASIIIMKEQEITNLNEQLQDYNRTIEELRKREEENALLLAQNKLMIHSELENKEREVKTLKETICDFEKKLEQFEKENIELNKKTLELVDIQQKYKQLVIIKQDFEAKVISNEHILKETQKEVKEKEKLLESLTKTSEEKLENLQNEFESQINQLKKENVELSNIIEQKASSDSITKLNTLEMENKTLKEKLEIVSIERDNLEEESKTSGEEIESLNVSLSELLGKIKEIEYENNKINKNLQEMLSNKASEVNYEDQLKLLQDEILQKTAESKEYLNKITEINDLYLKQSENENVLKEENISLQQQIEKYNNEKAAYLKEKKSVEQLIEKERSESKSQVTNILQEIGRMEEEIKDVKKSHSDLENEKLSLEKKIEKMTKQNQENKSNNKLQAIIAESELNIQQLESNLNKLQDENTRLIEQNTQLMDKLSQLEKTIQDNESNFKKEQKIQNDVIRDSENKFAEISRKYDNSNETIKKLQEKMSQLLDENSRLHNTKEIMEHEFRSVQSQNELKEKEKQCVLDSNKFLEEELKKLREENENLNRERDNLNEMSNNMRGDLQVLNSELLQEKRKHESLLKENQTLLKRITELETNMEQISDKMAKSKNEYENVICQKEEKILNINEEYKILQIKYQEREDALKILQNDFETLEKQLNIEKERNDKHTKESKVALKDRKALETEMKNIQQQFSNIQNENITLKEENETFKKEVDMLNNKNQTRLTELETLLKRTNDEKQTLKESIKNATDLEKKLQNYENLKIENEYLNTLVNQLETELRKQNDDRLKTDCEIGEMKEKMKSQQCELYVLTESKEKHEEEMKRKDDELISTRHEVEKVKEELEHERQENKQQLEHNKFVMHQNDTIQKELLLCQQKLEEAHRLCSETRESYQEILNNNEKLKSDIKEAEDTNKNKIEKLLEELNAKQIIIDDLTKDLKQTTILLDKLENVDIENNELKTKVQHLELKIPEENLLSKETEQNVERNQENENEIICLRNENDRLIIQIEELKKEISVRDLKSNQKELSDNEHTQETFSAVNEIEEYKCNFEKTKEEIKTLKKEKEDMEAKLNKIINEVQDVSNRNLFLEQKCENYLILEQSNERLKLANEKLSRQLDETLVSIHHNENISANTEFEYLRNIMFQYLTGNINGNNSTLVKVIAAVLKFSPQQTQVVIEKEHQKHSLLGQLNKLL